MFLTAKVISTIHASQFQEFLEICTVELSESDNIRVAYKQVQAWESTANMALLGVNNGLCPEGVAQVLTFRLKENERKLINANKPMMSTMISLCHPSTSTRRSSENWQYLMKTKSAYPLTQ